ncbi:metal-dependent transcriptional regulator [archaeon]|nr:MAG: metal-dependent transcriptional regulator [archaeon]RLG65396.1 MAG: metal-dependent transcriptional regulator [archaeon]HDM23456.1 metal-dependent transcriptional regulator [Candidatus Bathyarchaeota archaeon]
MRVSFTESIYLTEIYRLNETGQKRIIKTLSDKFKVRPATVETILKRLIEKGMMLKLSRGRFHLTDKGLNEASKLIAKHRILECMLVNILGLPLEKACCEASKIAYHLSTETALKMHDFLGNPTKCPCGRRIPLEALEK